MPSTPLIASSVEDSLTEVGSQVCTLTHLHNYGGRGCRADIIIRKMPLVSINDVDKTEAWFIKHEANTVFYGRMVPIFRSLISIPAGVERMNMGLFVAYTTAGSLIWNSTLTGLGFILGENFHLVEEYVSLFQYLAIVVVIIGVGYFVARRLRQRNTKQQ